MQRLMSLMAWALLITGCEKATPDEALSITGGGQEQEGDPPGNGPFGFTMGMPIDKVDGAQKLDTPGAYVVNDPPKSHPDFEQVVLIAYPGTGICLIRGIGKNIEGDGTGGSGRAKVDSLAAALETKYGKSKLVDICATNEIACDGQFWMMTMLDGERAYGHSWEKPTPAMKAANLSSIYVIAKAADISTTFPMIEFSSSNEKGCEAAERAASVEAL